MPILSRVIPFLGPLKTTLLRMHFRYLTWKLYVTLGIVVVFILLNSINIINRKNIQNIFHILRAMKLRLNF